MVFFANKKEKKAYSAKRERSGGFSLVEILLVVAIGAIIFLFSAPYGLRFYRSQLIEDAGNNIAEALDRARHNAILQKNDSNFGVHFSLVDNTYTLFQGDSYLERVPTYDELYPLPDGIDLTGLEDIVFSKLTGLPNNFGTSTLTYDSLIKNILVSEQGVVSVLETATTVVAGSGCDATGGDETVSGDYTIHTFTTVGEDTFTINSGTCTVDILVVAGGGGGGAGVAGGGGAGGVKYSADYSLDAQDYTVIVGDGGAGRDYSESNSAGANGENSSFDSLVAIGGGGGGNRDSYEPGLDGGSGGGGGGSDDYSSNYGGTGTINQGSNGGYGRDGGVDSAGGGGGGAGGAGEDSPDYAHGGDGGIGIADTSLGNILTSASAGVSVGGTRYIAGGGGGGSHSGKTVGGSGGGGAGGQVSTDDAVAGVENTGSGGGGGGGGAGVVAGKDGGSGIVIVRYLTDGEAGESDPESEPDPVPTEGLISYWPFNGNANDSVGSSNGTVTGATLTTGVEGEADTAYNFNGSSDYITYSRATDFDLSSPFTISTWINTSSVAPGSVLRFDGDAIALVSSWSSLNGDYENYITFTGWRGTCEGYTNAITSSVVTNDGEWHHVVSGFDGTDLFLYVDGALQGTSTCTPDNVETFWFGKHFSDVEFFSGNIDEARVYNRALTGPEITALYEAVTPVAATPGSALSFDANSNTYVDIPIDLDENVQTIAFWFKTSSPTTGIYYVGDGAGSHDRNIALVNGDIWARLWDYEEIITSGTNYADGQWHFLVHKFDNNNGEGQSIWIDGQSVASGWRGWSDFNWQDRLTLGFDAGYSGYYTGEIDELTAWNRALSSEEIALLHAGGLGLYGNTGIAPFSTGGLLGGWHFDDGSSTSATDFSGNGHTGTLYNGTSWVDGYVVE